MPPSRLEWHVSLDDRVSLPASASFRIDLPSRSVEGVLRDRIGRELDGADFTMSALGRAVEILVDALDVDINFHVEHPDGRLHLDVETQGNWDDEIGEVIREVLQERMPLAVAVDVRVTHREERQLVYGLGRDIIGTTRGREPARLPRVKRRRPEPVSAEEARPTPNRFQREPVI